MKSILISIFKHIFAAVIGDKVVNKRISRIKIYIKTKFLPGVYKLMEIKEQCRILRKQSLYMYFFLTHDGGC